ncbi:hypothetical protein OF855_24665 [Mycolicibacterium fortuitum]|uniref:hypothetical protein n=1 Tax=Mycolicibacterium fortuitum TaxID=1766 RepID=UPI0022BA5202|nr:hypothetical protein [Mycolicibacterium fortuitum]WAY18433.1 hypothetical protein OF855_24665 [Mycolicibacterium fortuitum]
MSNHLRPVGTVRPVWCPHDTRRQPKPKLREWLWCPLLIGAAILSGLYTAPHARADGYLTPGEAQYTARYGPTMVCQTIAAFPSSDGVMGVAAVIMDDGFTADSTADIINASVLVYCDQYFPLLQAIGSKARAGDSKGMAV